MATSVHFWSINGTFRPPQVQCRQLPATFSAAVVPSINFRCIDETLQQLLVRGGNSRLLPERQQTFRQLSVHPQVSPSTFRASEGPSVTFLASVGPSVNISQISAQPRDLPSTFCVALGLSVNFCQISLHSWDIPSTSRVPTRLSVNLHQLSVRPRDVLSAFCVVSILSVNCREIFMRTSTLHQISYRPWDHP